MEYPIKVNYKYTTNSLEAKEWLNLLPNLFAADFETANELTKIEIEELKNILNEKEKELTFNDKINIQQRIQANGLSHPYLTTITHLSVAWSEKDAYVFLIDNNEIFNCILEFLINTDKAQIWHNCGFDFKTIYFYTNKLPKNYIDSQLLARSLLNDANSFKCNTKLKTLMAYAYGDWAISKDNFVIEDMYNENVIKYSATDSCATYKLYQDIMNDLNKWSI